MVWFTPTGGPVPKDNQSIPPDPASVAKAARLRQQMADLESRGPRAASPAGGVAPPSPREFIQRRMAELGGPPRSTPKAKGATAKPAKKRGK